jgi:excisionase family DNA binding protein
MQELIVTTQTDLQNLIRSLIRNEFERFQNNTPVPIRTQPEFITVEQASQLLNLAVSTIYGHVNKRTIPHIKQGKRLYFQRTELTQWLMSGSRRTVDEIRAGI